MTMREEARSRFTEGSERRRRGDLAGAARCFRDAIVADPLLFDAGQALAETIAAEVRARAVPSPPALALPAVLPTISVIVCSNRPQRFADCAQLYALALAPAVPQIVGIHDARSLCEGYERGIRASRGDVLILSHDDVDILAPDFLARLLRALQHFDLCGVAGATRLTGPAWGWAGHPHVHGWIAHRPGGHGAWRPAFWSPAPMTSGAVALDGVFLAGRRHVFEQVRFDAQTFDGFHGYDIDFTLRAAQAGYRVGVCGDLGLVHESLGVFDADWQRYAERFRVKHPACNQPQRPSHRYEIALPTREAAHAFFQRLEALAPASGVARSPPNDRPGRDS